MRTCTLLLPIILWASTAAGQPISPDDPCWILEVEGISGLGRGAAEIPASIRDLWELFGGTPTLPATIAVTTPVDISFTPLMPTPQDEVVMTITGWTQFCLFLDRVEVRTEGREIFVGFDWSALTVLELSTVEQVPRARMTSTLHQYRFPQSLGTFAPGTYTVHVTNRGVMSGDASASFTVRDRYPSIELDTSFWPSWFPSWM